MYETGERIHQDIEKRFDVILVLPQEITHARIGERTQIDPGQFPSTVVELCNACEIRRGRGTVHP